MSGLIPAAPKVAQVSVVTLTRHHGPLPSQLHNARLKLVHDSALIDGFDAISDAYLWGPQAELVHVLAYREEELIGYGCVDATGGAELLIHPGAREQGSGELVFNATLANHASSWWAHGDTLAARHLAAAHELQRERELLVLHRDLLAATLAQAAPDAREVPAGFLLRSYAGGSDNGGILAVNAAAFTDLPDQGGWHMADLTSRLAASWFDPELLLVLTDTTGEIVGFHWLKQHSQHMGEVFVIALAPTAQGQGLGQLLTQAGLAALYAKGCREIHLYVDSHNLAAQRTYRKLGFGLWRRDVQYRRGH